MIVQDRVGIREKSPAIPLAARPPVFIVGCPRSGTTLLRMMLDSHPELAIPPESHFIPKVWAVRRRYQQNGSVRVDRIASDIIGTDRFREWSLPEKAVWRRLHDLSNPGIADVIEAFFVAYAEREGKSRWGDKTPGNSLDMPVIARLFPTARFVHLIRDGRDVAMSLREHLGLGHTDAALVWATRVRKARKHARGLGSERYLEVRYEELVEDPRRELVSICNFVDLPYRPEMLEYAHRLQRAVPEHEQHRIHSNLGKPPTKGLRDWRHQMTPSDIALFEALAGRELEAFGYRRATSRIPPGVHRQAWAALTANGMSRLAWRARSKAVAALKRDQLPPATRW